MSQSKNKSKRLGRGLSALLGDDRPQLDAVSVSAPEAERGIASGTVTESNSGGGAILLPVAFIERNSDQPRVHFDQSALDDLTRSVREKGLLQPILVRPMGKDRYQIVAGERRWRAAQQAGLHEVPVLSLDLDDRDVLEVAIVENVQRQDLTPMEEARGYDRLVKDFGHTQDMVAKIVGKSRSHVANILRLLGLPQGVQELVDAGKLSMGHARALVGLPNAAALAKDIVDKGLSVRQAEALAASDKAPGKENRAPRQTSGVKDTDTLALEKDLSAALGLKVSIDHAGEQGGVIKVQYKTLEQLDDVCAKLGVCGL